MNAVENPAAEDTEEIPPPPEGYDPEKPVVFLFETSGWATLIWDYQLSEVRHLGKDYASYKDWQRELFVPTEMECSVFPLTENERQWGNELESFKVNVCKGNGDLPELDSPDIGVVLKDSVGSGEFNLNAKWQARDQITASIDGLRIGKSFISPSELMSSGSWDGLAASEEFFFWGMEIDPVDLSNWPFPARDLNSAFLLFMDAAYIMHNTRFQNRPLNLSLFNGEIACGPGWETLLEMVQQMPEDKRRWLNCPQEDIERLLREVNRNHTGTAAAQASLELF